MFKVYKKEVQDVNVCWVLVFESLYLEEASSHAEQELSQVDHRIEESKDGVHKIILDYVKPEPEQETQTENHLVGE